MDDPLPVSAIALMLTLGLGSLGTLAWLFQRHIGGRPLLAYEPRRPVPWNALAPILVLWPTIMTIAIVGSHSELAPTETTDALAPSDVWGYAGASLLLTATFLVALIVAFRATPSDLGLPRSWRELRRDALIGVATFLAVLVPVYALQMALTEVLEPDKIHPLIEDLNENFSGAMILAAFATAVVAAPWHEETVFRLIFQGWLEKKEDAALGYDPTPQSAADGGVGPIGVAPDEGADESEPVAPPEPPASPPRPAMGVLPGLPHGWAPVLASGALFALAHLGHGVAPVSLFPLGVALGYVYQRTHRILPSIVCHMLFNGLTMTMLWLSLSAREIAHGQ